MLPPAVIEALVAIPPVTTNPWMAGEGSTVTVAVVEMLAPAALSAVSVYVNVVAVVVGTEKLVVPPLVILMPPAMPGPVMAADVTLALKVGAVKVTLPASPTVITDGETLKVPEGNDGRGTAVTLVDAVTTAPKELVTVKT
jgi:hypothetical protein